MENITFIIIGSACLLIGLLIYFNSINRKYYHSIVIIGWLLIALFPVFIIFPFFPDSTVDGKIFNFSFGGALAAFIFIWWFGSKKSMHGIKIDLLIKENLTLKEKLSNLPQNESVKQKGKILTQTKKHLFALKNIKNKSIGIITGAVSNVKGIDVWVNSENTNMQMARFYESSVSAVIRYLGAEKDQFGNVIDDLISNSLKDQLGDVLYVHPTTVIITSSGNLSKSHKVKKIVHVASVQGEVGSGYKPISNIHNCVGNVLDKVDKHDENLETVLFPLLGTGTAKGNLTETVSKLFSATITYFEQNPNSKIKEVLFLAYTDIQLNHCLTALGEEERIKKME